MNNPRIILAIVAIALVIAGFFTAIPLWIAVLITAIALLV